MGGYITHRELLSTHEEGQKHLALLLHDLLGQPHHHLGLAVEDPPDQRRLVRALEPDLLLDLRRVPSVGSGVTLKSGAGWQRVQRRMWGW